MRDYARYPDVSKQRSQSQQRSPRSQRSLWFASSFGRSSEETPEVSERFAIRALIDGILPSFQTYVPLNRS